MVKILLVLGFMGITALVHILPEGKSSPLEFKDIIATSAGHECPPSITTFGLLSSYLEGLLDLPHRCSFQVLKRDRIMDVESLLWITFNDQTPVEEGYVIVRIIKPTAGDVYGREVTYDVRAALATPANPIPQEHQLPSFVAQVPDPQDRFPVPPDMFLRLPDENRDKIFRPAVPGEKCNRIIPLVHNLIEPPVAGGSEDNFHHFWDSLLSDVLEFFFVADAWFKVRNQAGERSSGVKRPDMVARFARLYALLRAEEKGPKGKGNPEDEIIDKMEWTYGTSIPYILGYYATEYMVTFCSLSCHSGRNMRRDIARYNLRLARDRVEAFIACMNCARVLTTLRDLCVSANALPDFVEYERPNGKLVQIFQRKVVKTYSEGDLYTRVKIVYTELRECPGVEVMLHFNDEELSIVFKRGYSSEPASLDELRKCLRDLCETLVWQHSRGWMHRDIRWENVVVDEGRRWLLLDYDKACKSPCAARHALNPDTHAPEMTCGPHTMSVDVWSLGHLLSTCGMELPQPLLELKELCLNPNPELRPTAVECLTFLN